MVRIHTWILLKNYWLASNEKGPGDRFEHCIPTSGTGLII